MRPIAFALALAACAGVRTPAPPSRAVSADGIAIDYVSEGSGPAVMMLHCLGCNLHYWDDAAADLKRDHRVVRFDFPGHGGSGSGRKNWTIEAFAGDVRAVANAAGVDEFVVVGHSMSGTIALETAKELGERVIGVVPVDSVLDVDAHVPPDARAALVERVRTDYRSAIEAQFPLLLPKNPDPKVVARVRADALAHDPVETAAVLDSLLAYREDETLDRLPMPIIAIDADRRPLARDHNRAHAPQFDARIIPDTGHWLMLDKPAEFAATLRAAVTSIESGAARRRP